jgi:hypothetical protein
MCCSRIAVHPRHGALLNGWLIVEDGHSADRGRETEALHLPPAWVLGKLDHHADVIFFLELKTCIATKPCIQIKF